MRKEQSSNKENSKYFTSKQCDHILKILDQQKTLNLTRISKARPYTTHNHNNSVDEYYNNGSDSAYEVVSNEYVRMPDKVNHFSTYDFAENLSSETVSNQ